MIGAVQYHRPATPEEAAELLAQTGSDAVVLGGGTMLVPMLVRRDVRVAHVIDPLDLALTGISVSGAETRIGARVTYADVLASHELREAVPILARMAREITGGAQIRNQGTLGGSACFANPSSDVPAVLVALNASLVLHGPQGRRAVPAEEFYDDAFETARRPDELLVEIAIPANRATWGYAKLKISESSWPIATAVASRDSATRSAWVTLGAVHRRPLRIAVADPAHLDELVAQALTDPWHDVHAPGEYRRDVAAVIARRAWAEMDSNDQDRDR